MDTWHLPIPYVDDQAWRGAAAGRVGEDVDVSIGYRGVHRTA